MDLTALMTSATADLSPSPTLLREARKGGARRKHRRQAGVAALGLIGIAGGSVLVPVLHGGGRSVTTPAGALYDGRTRGDLAGDASYLQQVLRTWNTSHGNSENAERGVFADLRGEPHVIWAGVTPVGPAALVAQDAFIHSHDSVPTVDEGLHELLGFVGVDTHGAPRVVGDEYQDQDAGGRGAWFVDLGQTVVAALDSDGPRRVATGWDYSDDGAARQRSTPLVDQDGVAVAVLPKGTLSGDVQVQRVKPARGVPSYVGTAGQRYETGTHLAWQGVRRLDDRAVISLDDAEQSIHDAEDEAREGSYNGGFFGEWLVVATLPDGQTLLARDAQLDSDPSRVNVLLRDGGQPDRLLSRGPVDPSAVLPVQVLLPDAQGTLVARYGAALAYRVGDGAWQSVGRDAALLPASATAVRVTPDGGTAAVVTLA